MKKKCRKSVGFSRVKGRIIETDFNGGDISSDGGLLLIEQVDRKLGLTRNIAKRLDDTRQVGKIRHESEAMLRQRVFGLSAGWEDLNDSAELRHDSMHQIAVGKDGALASAPTLSRFENAQSPQSALAVNLELIDQFIASHRSPPPVVVLDFDGTDTPVHGDQERRFFHGYYDCHCFLPLYVFCGDQLLVAYLRPSNADSAKHAAAVLKLLIKRLRQVWPRTRFAIRADSGFCRNLLLSWCDRNDVKYIIGIARNSRLLAEAEELMERAESLHESSGKKQRLFDRFDYAADSWSWIRSVIVKAEHGSKGANPRFIVTNIVGDPKRLYDQRYCIRGEMENRIKEQMMLFADRVSAHRWWANQWRILLSALAYTLLEALRRFALKGTALARATVATIRLKLIKIGAVIVRKKSVIRIHLSSHHPLKDLFAQAAACLSPP